MNIALKPEPSGHRSSDINGKTGNPPEEVALDASPQQVADGLAETTEAQTRKAYGCSKNALEAAH